jgi:hypothetical protein
MIGVFTVRKILVKGNYYLNSTSEGNFPITLVYNCFATDVK